ncbi:MurR/RpiR family transcriptional regulator [Enterococcus sp. AZ072]|uniref:MurR/RpiR family transcriptional regulator n=1 Tax=unclassified Enterococcus TaxID=2608891 RepID=UPI003D2D9A05
MNDFFAAIEIEKLSENEQTMLKYIQDNSTLIAQMKLHDLASKLFVSDTLVVRFCQKLGLTGFSELKYLIKNELVLQKKRQKVFREQIDQQINDFKYFLAFAPLDQLHTIVQLLCNDQPLYIHGRSLSSIPAKYLHTVLNTLNRRCILVEDLHLLKSISRTIHPGATILITSANVPLAVYQEVFDNSRQNQAKTILITSQENDQTTNLADFCLFSNDTPLSYNETDANSRINMLSLIQIIIELASKELLAEESTAF